MNDETLFHLALQKPAGERASFLREACGGDATRRERMETLLAAHEHPGDFLAQPCVDVHAAAGAAVADSAPRPNSQSAAAPGEADLSFLAPSTRPGSLGRLDHYEIQKVVGIGGMGIVFKAFDEKLHRVVAIKMMSPDLAASGTARQRFIREARAAAAVSHEHVVTIHAVEEAHRPPYLVMQFIDGVSLQQKLDERGALGVNETLRIGLQTAAGLAAAHAQGVVHRDIKPANILLENGVERVKITDFGLARAAGDASVTQTGLIAGTPQYMAPEQALGSPLDHRADLFSLGSVLYAMCTGRAPFRGSTTVSVLKRVCEETPLPIREANPDVPRNLVEIVEKLHAKEPSERIQKAQEVASLLGQELARLQQPTGANIQRNSPLPLAPARSRRWTLAAALLVCLAAAFALTEATGLTRLAATVLRSPPPETLRRPTPDTGSPAKIELAAANTPPLPDAANPFVILRSGGMSAGQFDTLAEAVLAAGDGDTIEVHGNGPFASDPVTIRQEHLTIRAAASFRPVLRLNAKEQPNDTLQPLIRYLVSGSLVLEGLELQGERPKELTGGVFLVHCGQQGSLYVANCRFQVSGFVGGHCIWSRSPVTCKNCEFVGPGFTAVGGGVSRAIPPLEALVLDNCVQAGGKGVRWHWHPNSPQQNVLITRSSLVCFGPVLNVNIRTGLAPVAGSSPPLVFQAADNVLTSANSLLAFSRDTDTTDRPPLPPTAAHELMRLAGWGGERNVYAVSAPFLNFGEDVVDWPQPRPTSVTEWGKFWQSPETGSATGKVQFRGGDLVAKALHSPHLISPEDFRLLPGSAGYRAGPNGKDLGADIDLVGPGAAYERWKQTIEYEEWLKETGQKKESGVRDQESENIPKQSDP